VCSTECTEGEKAAAEKRDVVKAKVDEINLKLSQINENKKEKMKDAKKMHKCVVFQLSRADSYCLFHLSERYIVWSPVSFVGMDSFGGHT